MFVWFLQVYHAKRMQRVFCVRFSGDGSYVFSGSDDMNVRVWKAEASEQLGVTLPREKHKQVRDCGWLQNYLVVFPLVIASSEVAVQPWAVWRCTHPAHTRHSNRHGLGPTP
jgi:WD40 repeat protein